MAAKSLRFEKGDTLALPGPEGKRGLWTVERRVRSGYVLASKSGEPDRLWTHEEIYEVYSQG